MGPNVESVTYWVFLLPVSIVGIVCNFLIIWTWCGERYKFNRLIIMTLEAVNCAYLITYHVWRNIRRFKGNYEKYSSIIVFTVRFYAVILYIFLSAMQYLWLRDLKFCRFNRMMFSKVRIIVGIIVIFISCLLLRLLNKVIRDRLPPDQSFISSAVFNVLLLGLPQFLQMYSVVGMVMNVRRKNLVMTAMTKGMFVPSRIQSLKVSIHNQVVKSIRLLSIGSQVSPERVQSDTLSGSFSPRTHALLMMNVLHEMSVTKAILALCVPLIFIYLILPSVEMYFILTKDKRQLYLTFAVWDILQFLYASCHLCILVVMLPSFRKSFKKRWSRLWNRGQTNEDEEMSKESGANQPSVSDNSFPSSSSSSSDANVDPLGNNITKTER